VRILKCILHETAGASRHPAFPAPSHFQSEAIQYNSGKSCCENANMYLSVIASAAKQSIVTPRAERWIASLRSQ